MKIADLFMPPMPVETLLMEEPAVDRQSPSLEARFMGLVRRHPERIAVRDASGQLDFRELDRFSGALARFILQRTQGAETAVGVMCGRSRWFVAAALGILRAGAIYVPIDPALPYARKEEMLRACGAPLVIVEQATIGDAVTLQYACAGLDHLLCVNADHFAEAIEPGNERMSRELWEQVTAQGADASWIRMTDRKPYPPTLPTRLAENVWAKTADKLGPASRVLDIGSGSGAVARCLAAHCAHYTAVDLSRLELERLQHELAEQHPGLEVVCHPYEAMDIGLLPSESFDLIVMNSVAENFPGLNYLRAVLDHCLGLLAPDGVLFCGGLLDPQKREALVAEVRDFAARTGEMRGVLQLDSRVDLFVPRDFFRDWAAQACPAVALDFSPSGIAEPELAEFRYDLRIRRVADTETNGAHAKQKRGYGAGDLERLAENETVKVLAGLPEVPCDRAAYIIFTSGSTGPPKGVVVEHRSLLNLADALDETVYAPVFGDAPQEIALVASFSFDASLQQMIMSLTRGHSLTIVPEATKREQGDLSALYHERRIVLSDMTPSLFGLFVDHLIATKEPTAVKMFIVGGEKLTRDLLASFYSLRPHADTRIVNAYGPTECCVDAALHPLTHAGFGQYDVPPIGRPIRNTIIQLRDAKGGTLLDGIPGELWIGGLGVARGYLNDSPGTRARFVSDEKSPWLRWYRSGDYGRRLNDGTFHFIGREDDQVKIGGFRIELGEVEAALRRCPLVREAAVKAADLGNSGTNVLIAYIVPHGEMDVQAIKRFVQSQLPAHAVPSRFMGLDRLLFTASGKIDRKRLPSPSDPAPPSAAVTRPPRGDVETTLAGLWQTLLGAPVQDAQVDFFTLGGHSVLAVRLMALIEKRFGLRLPLSQLFDTPTIEGLANHIARGANGQKPWNPLIPVRPSGRRPPIFFFHPVGGNVICYQGLARELSQDQPVYMLESPGLMEGQPSLASVEALVDFYLRFMLPAVPEGPLCLAGWSFGGLLAYEAARQLRARGRRVAALILLDTVAAKERVRELMRQDEAGFLAIMFGEMTGMELDLLRRLDPDQRIDEIVRRGQARGSFPVDFGREQMQLLLKVYMQNGLAAAKYALKPWPGAALLIRPGTISASALNVSGDDLQGWGALIQGGIRLAWMDGTHETMLEPPYLRDLGRIVRDYLDDATETCI